MKLRVNRILKYVVVDGHNLRLTVFTQGCEHHCVGCHNPQTHDPCGGYNLDLEEILKEIKNTPYIRGVTISGGDPLYQYDSTMELCRRIKEETQHDIIMYTGYIFEDIQKNFPKILNFVDFIVDGPFLEELKTPDLYFMGSSNQRYIDVRRSLQEGSIVQRSDYCLAKVEQIG